MHSGFVRLHRIAAASSLLLAVGCSKDDVPAGPGGIATTPLRARGDGASPAPKFVQLAAADTGIDFRNRLRPENRYTYLTNGAGLAVGDYDGDGLVDVYLISQDGPNQLFRQISPLRFQNVTAQAGGVDGGEAWGSGASFVDIDGDGDLDLYVCNIEAKNLLYVNQGDGTFVEDGAKFGLDITAASTMCSFADYDRDGRPDLYLLTNRALHAGWTNTPPVLDGMRPPADTARSVREMVPSPAEWHRINELQASGKLETDADVPDDLREHFIAFRGRRYSAGQPDRLLRNVGGRFVDVSSSAGIVDRGMGLSATWFDYDDDGWPDLYVANDLETPDTLYHNERDGTFRKMTAEVVPHTAYYGMGSDFADVDGDGRFDLLVADMSMTTHEKAKVLMGDMDEERPVLLHWEPPQVMRNALLLNTGLGRFQEAAKLAGVSSTDWTWAVRFEDLDLDGRVDLFATNGIARFDTDPDLKLRVEKLWAEGRQQAAIEMIENVGKVPEKNLALRNVADLQFEKTGADWGLDLEAVSHGAVVCDLDGDGDLDIVVNNFEQPASVYENRSTSADGRALLVRLRGRHSERFGVGARVYAKLPDGSRLVREMSLARGYLSGHPAELHFGVGQAAAVDLTVRWPSGHVQRFEAVATDQLCVVTEPGGDAPDYRVEGDAPVQSTLFVPADAPPFRHRENLFDEYEAQPLLPAGVSKLGPALAVSDNRVFVGGARNQAGAMYLRNGTGWRRIDGPWQRDAAHEDLGACFVDHDGDGDEDLVVTSGGAEVEAGDATLRDRLYRNDGDGVYVRDDEALPDDAPQSSGRVRAADFDGDGDVDLFVAGRLVPGQYPDAPPSRLYRNDDGRFVDVTAELAPALRTAGMVTDALWTDADGDDRLDLLVAARWQPLRLLRNDGERFVDVSEAAGLGDRIGWWNALHAVDVDGDGDLDYLCGNQGWNTKYKASPEHPARLYYGDFDDNGTRDLVEAKYEGERLLPVRGRSCSSGAMPVIAERFETYQSFAKSLLTDIYTEEKLAACGELVANELASCLLRNQGDGRFTFEHLPRRAQIAPIFAFATLGDLVVCAQNHFSPEPETGRHDGGTGLVLRVGDGDLELLAPSTHGICAFGDHKELGVVPGPEGDLVLFARNDGELHAWRRAEPKAPEASEPR